MPLRAILNQNERRKKFGNLSSVNCGEEKLNLAQNIEAIATVGGFCPDSP